MTTNAQYTANTKDARLQVQALAAKEKTDAAAAGQAVATAQTSWLYSVRKAAWEQADLGWRRAAQDAGQIAAWYQTALDRPDLYWPLAAVWDAMAVSTGKVASVRQQEYFANAAWAAKQAAFVPHLQFPSATQPGGGVGVGPGQGSSPLLPQDPVLPDGAGVGPSSGSTPLSPQGPGGITDPDSPHGGAPPIGSPGGPGDGAPPLGTSPETGTPLIGWLVPVGLVGAVLWHLLARGRK